MENKTQTTCDDIYLSSKSRTLAAQMRKTGRYPASLIFAMLKRIYSMGYAAGHEDQMKMRIQDQKEFRERMGEIANGR